MSKYQKYLDPILNRISDISNFNDVQIDSELESEELPHLKNTETILIANVQFLVKKLEALEEDLDKYATIVENETGDDKTAAAKIYNNILQKIEELIQRINRELTMVNTPYFGKVVFDRKTSDDFPATELTTYIGKSAYFDAKTGKALMTDWRAPIANLYYHNSGPQDDVSFEGPTGTQKGDLKQKRQFDIKEGRFQNIYDAKSGNVTADEFLLAQLSSRVGKKLADIVSTIQDKQNKIIRGETGKFEIIQGVAGSGKTTILLHKLAYLMFAYKESMRPGRMLIMAPNKYFLDYISDVLPSLGVEGIEANTYVFWAKKLLDWDTRYMMSKKTIDPKVREYKGSLEFIEAMISGFEEYEKDVLENIPYSRRDILRRRYYELKENHGNISMIERMELSLEYALANKDIRSGMTGAYNNPMDARADISKEVRQYMRKVLSPYKIYKSFIKDSNSIPKNVKTFTLSTLKGNNYMFEDLAPIVWIHLMINGIKDYEKDYIVADEAQDLSLFEIYTLLLIAKNQNLSIAGDLAQSIKPPFLIKDWKDIIKALEKLSGGDLRHEYHQLQKSYRTTVEIVDFTNKIIKEIFPTSYKLPEAVLRHGEPVEIVEISTKDKSFVEFVNKQFTDDTASVAIICKDEAHTQEVFKNIEKRKEQFDRRLLELNSEDYTTGISVLTVQKAKGLEFDVVIIADVNKDHYKDNELDARLFYVSATRSLHKLLLTVDSKKNISDIIQI